VMRRELLAELPMKLTHIERLRFHDGIRMMETYVRQSRELLKSTEASADQSSAERTTAIQSLQRASAWLVRCC
jgi:hypothetical protein